MAHVLQDAGDEAVGFLGEAPLPLGIEEDVLAVLTEGHVHVHAAAVDAEDGLGHEGGVEAVGLGDGLHRHAEGADVVRGGEGIGVFEVDLVLALGHLVVARLNLKAHLLQHEADLPPHVAAVVDGGHVEVAGGVSGPGGGEPLLVGLEEEELHLRPHVEGVAQLFRPLKGPPQHVPGIAHEGGAVRVIDVANEPGGLALGGHPGQHREGGQVRMQVLVALVDAGEALDGAAVDHDLVADHLLDLGLGDGHVLELAEDVGELEADELDILFVDDADDVFLGVFHGDAPFLFGVLLMFLGRFHQSQEQGMGLGGPALEFGMVLDPYEEGPIGELRGLHQRRRRHQLRRERYGKDQGQNSPRHLLHDRPPDGMCMRQKGRCVANYSDSPTAKKHCPFANA